MHSEKEPLYRKVNTRTRMVRHHKGLDYRHERNTKAVKSSEASRASMHGKYRRGFDYTPLYQFLLSKVGQPWAQVHQEAVARLDQPDPIFRMVARTPDDESPMVSVGEHTFYQGLRVDEEGILRVVSESIGPHDVPRWCTCCTYSFNGKPVPYVPPKGNTPAN